MNKKIRMIPIGILLACLFSLGAFAAVPNLNNLNQTQVDSVFQTFGADLAFRPLEPASTYGSNLGFSLGVIAGVASADKIKDSIPNVSLGFVPNAEIFLGLQGPMGFGLELGFLPDMKAGGAKLKKLSGDIKWTANEMFPILPIDAAARFMLGSSKLEYSQVISGVNDTVTYDASNWGFNFSASKAITFFEPYIGLGLIHQSATLSNTGTLSLFNSTVTATNSFESSDTSSWLYAGFQLRFLIVTLSAEMDRMFGTNTYQAKLAFKL